TWPRAAEPKRSQPGARRGFYSRPRDRGKAIAGPLDRGPRARREDFAGGCAGCRGRCTMVTMIGRPGIVAFLAVVLLGLVGTARASMPGAVVQSARTIAHGVHDSVMTLGRTTRALVVDGRDAAKAVWAENVELTREHARRNADRALDEAGL